MNITESWSQRSRTPKSKASNFMNIPKEAFNISIVSTENRGVEETTS